MVRSKSGGVRHWKPPADAHCRSRSRLRRAEVESELPATESGHDGETPAVAEMSDAAQVDAASISSYDPAQLQLEPACVPNLTYCELLTKCIIAEYGTEVQGKRILSSVHSFCRQQTALKTAIVDGSLEAAAKPPEHIWRRWRKYPRELVQTLQNGDGVPLNDAQKEGVFSAVTRTLTLVQGPPGTGKSNVAKHVVKMLGEEHHYLWRREGAMLMSADSNPATDLLSSLASSVGLTTVRAAQPWQQHAKLKVPYVTEFQRASQLTNASVVCATTEGVHLDTLRMMEFPTVVVDEAAQVTEVKTLTALWRFTKHVVLIGDHLQLPPTVRQAAAKDLFMEVSLFERLVQEKFPVTVLSVQYRMMPRLSRFPSKFFYNDKIQNFRADGSPPWEMWGSPWDVESPVTIIDVSKEAKKSATGSWMNAGEALFVQDVLSSCLRNGHMPDDIAVLTTYSGQCELLQSMLEETGVDVLTVDAAQGQERKIIIFNTVRTEVSKSIGHVADLRRVNVAITRARDGLIIIGDVTALKRDVSGWYPYLEEMKDVTFTEDDFYEWEYGAPQEEG